MNIPKKSLSVLIGAALAVSLTGCISLDEPTLGDTPASSEPVEAPASESPEAPDGVGTFGQVVSWDAVDVVISEPKPYEMSATGAGDASLPAISLDIKLTNTGDEPFDPSLVYITASSAEQEASAIFDTENGIEGAPMTPVLPGKSVNWTVAYNVADAGDVLVQLTPDMMLEPVLFSTGG